MMTKRIRQPQNRKLLGKNGIKAWKRIAPLIPVNATECDWDLLENYCLNIEQNTLSAEAMQDGGGVMRNSAGTLVKHPSATLFNTTSKQIVVLAEKLNLTALAQHRNQMEVEEDDGWDEI